LARHFVRAFATEYGVPLPQLTSGAERMLRQRRWPGNVRELRNAIERAVLLCDGRQLRTEDVEAESTADVRDENGIPFPAPLNAVIVAVVREMLALCGGNKSEAARRLGISRTRFQRLLDHGERAGDVEHDDETDHIETAPSDVAVPLTIVRGAAAGARPVR
jgi:DNA-binding NtrC family response regulator